jgi:molybdenum cofactor synthesis domain-containing protein
MVFRAGIIVASDKGSTGERADLSGKKIDSLLKEVGYEVCHYCIVPDEGEALQAAMKHCSDDLKLDLVLTTGGTGFSVRDVTPEATLAIIDKQVPGIPEAMRAMSMQITPRAMLSRAVAGIRNNTLIINMPGSPKAVEESLSFILPTLEHGLEILIGSATECGRR